MLNCTMLLESANRFGLKQGNCKCAYDARKTVFRVSYFSVNTSGIIG